MSRLQAAVAIREQQLGIAVHLPEAAQQAKCSIRQGSETVFIALGIADMDAPAIGVNIAHLETQAFTQAQAKAVDGEIEDPVTDCQGRHEQPLGFFDGDDIRQALGLWWLDETNVLPGLMQHMGVVEFQAVKIELDGAPGVRVE